MNSDAPASTAADAVSEAVRREVPDWDDDVVSAARFKAFSGQRSDWEPKYLFWRDLILKVARHLGTVSVRASEVKGVWFPRGGLTPLCIDRVLHEMQTDGDIMLRGDLVDPTSGRLYRILRRVGHMIGISRPSLQETSEDSLILRPLLQERAMDVINVLAEGNWTSACVVTLVKFQSFCKGPDEASMILGYLSECRKAQYLSIRKDDFVEGVKISLTASPVSSISSLDYDSLHLIWTMEKLQQQLDVIDRRCENSKKQALASLKSGNKQAAYRHIRQSKLLSESRAKCTSLLERVEEVLRVIADAESTKKVSEAIQVGVRAMKENRINVEELHLHLQEFDDTVAAQKRVNEALGSMTLQSVDYEDEDIEEDFKKLEMELADIKAPPKTQKPAAHMVPEKVKNQEPGSMVLQSVDYEGEDVEEDFKKLEMELADIKAPSEMQKPDALVVPEKVKNQEPSEVLCQTMSNLNLEEYDADACFVENTTVWAASFNVIGVSTACDSRCTTISRKDGKPSYNDKFQKCFEISEEITLTPAGSVQIARMCLGILRNIVKRHTGRGKITLRDLVGMFKDSQDVHELNELIKTLVANGDSDGKGCNLILSTNRRPSLFTPEPNVCQITVDGRINLKQEKLKFDDKKDVQCGLGAGTGYSRARKILNELSYYSTLDQIKEVVKRAFVEAAEDPDTGGSVLLFHVPYDSQCKLLDHHKLDKNGG